MGIGRVDRMERGPGEYRRERKRSIETSREREKGLVDRKRKGRGGEEV